MKTSENYGKNGHLSPDDDKARMQDGSASPSLIAAASDRKLLLGVVHLLPLPGSPRGRSRSVENIIARARADADAYLEAGFDGFVIENFGDTPFFPDAVPPHVLTLMTRVALALPRQDALVGANVLRNDARGALAVAIGADLDFVRVNVHTGAAVTDQGIIEGRAAETAREREALAPKVAILADVDVKHAAPLGVGRDLAESARDTAYRGLADGLIVTGKATGSSASLQDLETVTRAVPDRPVLVGSGVTADTVRATLKLASGVIVGTAVKTGGNAEADVDASRAREFVEAARG